MRRRNKSSTPSTRIEPPPEDRGQPPDPRGRGPALDLAITSNDQQHRIREERFWERQIAVAKWLNGITLVSAGVALLGLIAVYLSIVGADNATMKANRAWLSPSYMVLNKPLENGSGIGFQLHVENTGREPATNAVYAFHPFLAAYITQSLAREPAGENRSCEGLQPTPHSGITIYPGATKFWIPFNFEDKEVVSAILERKASLIVEGCIAYRTYDRKHTSAFRFFLRDTPGPSCWQSNEGVITAHGIIQCWGFNGMLNGNGPD